jgi:hypothetical protein
MVVQDKLHGTVLYKWVLGESGSSQPIFKEDHLILVDLGGWRRRQLGRIFNFPPSSHFFVYMYSSRICLLSTYRLHVGLIGFSTGV